MLIGRTVIYVSALWFCFFLLPEILFIFILRFVFFSSYSLASFSLFPIFLFYVLLVSSYYYCFSDLIISIFNVGMMIFYRKERNCICNICALDIHLCISFTCQRASVDMFNTYNNHDSRRK